MEVTEASWLARVVAFLCRSTGVSLPTRPDGSPALPVDGKRISAPVASDLVPDGAAVYKPKDSNCNCFDFIDWMAAEYEATILSKSSKVTPGWHSYDLGPVRPAGADADLYKGSNLVLSGSWTADLRGITFVSSMTPDDVIRRLGAMFYVNKSDELTILGKTF
ncbi:MAG: hypothetical protein Q9181_002743 [Wetmoreana brouardii]